MHSCPLHPCPRLLEDCIGKGKQEFGHLGLLVTGYIVSVKWLLRAYTQVSDVSAAHSDLLYMQYSDGHGPCPVSEMCSGCTAVTFHVFSLFKICWFNIMCAGHLCCARIPIQKCGAPAQWFLVLSLSPRTSSPACLCLLSSSLCPSEQRCLRKVQSR